MDLFPNIGQCEETSVIRKGRNVFGSGAEMTWVDKIRAETTRARGSNV